jgi:hypothetical protein
MVFVEGEDSRALRRPGDDPAQFRTPVRLPRRQAVGLDAAITNGLVAWYRFEDSANTAIDATNALGVGADQTAFDGTVNGASFVGNGGVTDVVSGPNSGAYSFDGVDDTIQANGQPVDSTTDMTLSVFVKPTGNSVSRILNTNDDTNGVRISYKDEQTGATPPVTLFEDGGSPDTFNVTPAVPQGTFTHLALTLNVSNNAGRLFKNGNLQETITTSGSGSDPIDFTIGAKDPSKTGINFPGIIDDVRCYNRALSASEIRQIYQNTKA